MKLIKKSIAVMLMLMASVPCLYAAHGDLEEQPKTWEEFVSAYNKFSSRGFHAIDGNRIEQEGNKIIIDLHFLNKFDRATMRADLGKIQPPEGSEIKFVYTHGDLEKQPKTWEEFVSAYNKFYSRQFSPLSKDRIVYRGDYIEIDLHGLTLTDSINLHDDLLDLGGKKVLPNNKVMFITGQSVGSGNISGGLAPMQFCVSKKYKRYEKHFQEDNVGVVWVDLSTILPQPEKLPDLSKYPSGHIAKIERSAFKSAPSSLKLSDGFANMKKQKFTSPLPNPPTFSLGITVEKPKKKSTPSTPQPFSNFGFTDTTDQKFTLSIPNTTTNIASGPKSNVDKRPSAQSAPSSPGLFDNFDFTKIKKQKSTSPLPKPPILSLGNSAEKPKPNTAIKRRDTSSKFSAQMNRKNQPV